MFIYAGNISGMVYEKLVYVFLQEDWRRGGGTLDTFDFFRILYHVYVLPTQKTD